MLGLPVSQDALEGLSLPENFVAQDVLPQLELLQKCHAFITHGGANSVHEALSFGLSAAFRATNHSTLPADELMEVAHQSITIVPRCYP